MAQVLLLLVVALTVGAVVFGVMVLVSGGDPGLREVEPDGRGIPLPGSRPLVEQDVTKVTFDLGLRGYRMDQVDRALKRVAYDIGYKDELINVLTAEVEALRDGRADDAEALRSARLAASGDGAAPESAGADADESSDERVTDSGSTIDLGPVEPVRDGSAYADEEPDGPFAPWPTAKDTEAAADDAEGDGDEADHPTDEAKASESGDDRVVTRG
jgi:DivIVA domain-containing protein